MSILCMTGWQQPAEALANIAPGAMHFDYAAYADTDTMFAALPPEPSLAIGWSLGGQLLVRAIAAGHLRPGVLWLLGAPFQWVANAGFPYGVPSEVAADVQKNYAADPTNMLTGFNTLIALGDTQEKRIIRALDTTLAVWKNGAFWLNELAQASCVDLDFSLFPPTTVFHGLKDKVIDPENARTFAEQIPDVELLPLEHCAHAPHLHDQALFTERLRRYV